MAAKHVAQEDLIAVDIAMNQQPNWALVSDGTDKIRLRAVLPVAKFPSIESAAEEFAKGTRHWSDAARRDLRIVRILVTIEPDAAWDGK